ncbi:response regulator [Algicola sagamiensis]|uniref:response regulator n=1 Tax=Algicola sagamiensis TaxID=163869 RepID=UPI00037A6D99|nr:response regulator [Algicola sagamiensis]
MATPLLICDDSNLARKQMARSLPDHWDVDITFASHGQEAMEVLKNQKVDLLFLDLNMPVMDGYEVLQAMRDEDLHTMAIVVSGDVQPEAKERVMQLGALDFIKKPVDKEKLAQIVSRYGLELSEVKEKTQEKVEAKEATPAHDEGLSVDLRDVYQEITNVAMGQAGDLLARLLHVFVELPIPNVNVVEVAELHMALQSVEDNVSTSAVCQGFISGGMAGEALLILNDSSFKDIAQLLKYEGELNDKIQLELLMDIANILIGAILNGLSEQLDISFSQGHPVVLGQHCQVSDLIHANSSRWKRTLGIEISYGIENYDITCDLLLLFTEDSIPTLNTKVAYLLDD